MRRLGGKEGKTHALDPTTLFNLFRPLLLVCFEIFDPRPQLPLYFLRIVQVVFQVSPRRVALDEFPVQTRHLGSQVCDLTSEGSDEFVEGSHGWIVVCQVERSRRGHCSRGRSGVCWVEMIGWG